MSRRPKPPVNEKEFQELLAAAKALPWQQRERLLREIRGEDTVTVEEVAGRFHVSWRTVQRHIKAGTIKGIKAGKRWVLARQEFERLEAEGLIYRAKGRE